MIHKLLGTDEAACSSIYHAEQRILEVSFDKRKLGAPQILSAIMEIAEVTDVKLQETDLSQIVKKIYTHTLSGEAVSESGDCK